MEERGHLSFREEDGGVAQLGEHLLCKQGVIGSNPFISTSGEIRKGRVVRELPKNQEMGL